MIKKGTKLQLNFDQQLFTIDQKKPEGFEIDYRNASVPDSVIFVKARALINGNKATVWIDKV